MLNFTKLAWSHISEDGIPQKNVLLNRKKDNPFQVSLKHRHKKVNHYNEPCFRAFTPLYMILLMFFHDDKLKLPLCANIKDMWRMFHIYSYKNICFHLFLRFIISEFIYKPVFVGWWYADLYICYCKICQFYCQYRYFNMLT